MKDLHEGQNDICCDLEDMDCEMRFQKIEDELGFVKAKKGKKPTSKLQQLQQSSDNFVIKLENYRKSSEAQFAALKRKCEAVETALGESQEEIKHLKLSHQHYSPEPHPSSFHFTDHAAHYPTHFAQVKSDCIYPHDPSFKCCPKCSAFHS